MSVRSLVRAEVLSWAVIGGQLLVFAGTARAAEYYVATTGDDGDAGTLAEPFASLQKAADVAVAGDTVWIRGGTYEIVTPATSGAGIAITKSGTSDTNRIKFWAYPGEVPIFDFSRMVISTTGYTSGFAVSGSWLHFKGLEIRNVPMNTRSNTGFGVNDPAHDDIFELLNLHHNSGSGFFISHGGGGHLILNSDSHDNYDPTSSQGDGQNADGFGAHYQEGGAVTTFRGCRAWWNSDDGWDLISQEHPVVIENSWAFGNGYIDSGAARPADGNGNGFKAGSSKTGIRHVVRNNVAWGNAASGFYANHSSGGNDWYNNTSYDNGTQFNLLASTWDAEGNRTDGVTLTGALAHRMRNNVGFPEDNSYIEGYGVDTSFNTWDLGIEASESDFASVSDSGALGPRQADGSLPNVEFMRLREASRLLDRGTDVGLEYAGAAPDLGAHEYGTLDGAGGSAGTAGVGGSAGTSGASGGGGGGVAGSVSASGAAGIDAMPGGASGLGGSDATGGTSAGAGSSGTNAGSAGVSGTNAASAGTGGAGGFGAAGAASNASGGVPGAGSSADPGTSTEVAPGPNGCGCRVVHAARSSRGVGASALVIALALSALRRRRAQGRSGRPAAPGSGGPSGPPAAPGPPGSGRPPAPGSGAA